MCKPLSPHHLSSCVDGALCIWVGGVDGLWAISFGFTPTLSPLSPHCTLHFEWWDSLSLDWTLTHPPPSHLSLCGGDCGLVLISNGGPAHAGVQCAHQCLSTLSSTTTRTTLSPPDCTAVITHVSAPLSPSIFFHLAEKKRNKIDSLPFILCVVCTRRRRSTRGDARRKTHSHASPHLTTLPPSRSRAFPHHVLF